MRNVLSALLISTATATVAAPPTTGLEGKEGYERRSAIAEMADTLWQNQRFSIDRGMDILRGISGSDRYYATRTLLGENRQKRNLLPNRLTIREMHQLLEGTAAQRGALIQLLSDQGIPAAYLSATEIESLIAPLPPIDQDRALRALLGSNRMDRNYSLPNFKPHEVDRLLKNVSDRSGMIRYLANHTLLAGALTIHDAEQIMQQQSGMDRHDSIRALLGDNRDKLVYLTLPLPFDDTLQLLDGVALRSEMLNYFTDHGVSVDNLTAAEAKQLLHGVQQTDHFNTLKALLGNNLRKQRYLQHPLSAEDAITLLEGVAYRDQMVGYMADNQLLARSITADQATQLLGSLTRADRHDALRALLGGNELNQSYLQLPLSAEAATALLSGSAYRDELIQWISDQQQLEQNLDATAVLMLINGMVGDARYQALNSLLGNNLEKRHYLANTITATEWVTLLKGSANRLQLLQRIKTQMPIEIDSSEALQQLLGRLYGSEREAAAKLLTH